TTVTSRTVVTTGPRIAGRAEEPRRARARTGRRSRTRRRRSRRPATHRRGPPPRCGSARLRREGDGRPFRGGGRRAAGSPLLLDAERAVVLVVGRDETGGARVVRPEA